MFRDIVKKKRDEHIKMVWRVSPAHKRLQTRMEHMRSFRRQHEQLRTVIMRVLRPTLVSIMSGRQIDQQSQLPGTPDQVEVGDIKSEVLGLEAADANAIEVSFGWTDMGCLCQNLHLLVFQFDVGYGKVNMIW
jgi:hypothetical protein